MCYLISLNNKIKNIYNTNRQLYVEYFNLDRLKVKMNFSKITFFTGSREGLPLTKQPRDSLLHLWMRLKKAADKSKACKPGCK